jgi:hypothetical protein
LHNEGPRFLQCLAEAATIEGLWVQHAFGGEEPAHDLAGERQTARPALMATYRAIAERHAGW